MKKNCKYILIIFIMFLCKLEIINAATVEKNKCINNSICYDLCNYEFTKDGMKHNANIYVVNKAYDRILKYYVSVSWFENEYKDYLFPVGEESITSVISSDGLYKTFEDWTKEEENDFKSYMQIADIDKKLFPKLLGDFQCPENIYYSSKLGACFDNDGKYCDDKKYTKVDSTITYNYDATDVTSIELDKKYSKEYIEKKFDIENEYNKDNPLIKWCVFNEVSLSGWDVFGFIDQIYIAAYKNGGYRVFWGKYVPIDLSDLYSLYDIIEIPSSAFSEELELFAKNMMPCDSIKDLVFILDKKNDLTKYKLYQFTEEEEIKIDLEYGFFEDVPFSVLYRYKLKGYEEFINKDIVIKEEEEEEEEIETCEKLIGDKFIKEINSYLLYFKVAVPIIIIVMGSIDFGIAIISTDEDKMKKAQKKFITRLLIGVVIFFIPVFINVLLNIANQIWGILSGTCGIEF